MGAHFSLFPLVTKSKQGKYPNRKRGNIDAICMLGLASLKPESSLSSRLPPPHLSKPYSPAPSSLRWSRLWKLEFFPTSLAATIPLVRWKPDPSRLFSLPSDGSRIRATLKPVAEERRQLPWVNPVQKKDPVFGFSRSVCLSFG